MKDKKEKEEILSIPFIEKVRDEANRTIKEEVKGFGWDKKRTEVSEGQVRHVIEGYKKCLKTDKK